MHAIVDAKIVELHDPAVTAMTRSASEGPARHDCILAFAWALAHAPFDAMEATAENSKVNALAQYDCAVKRFSAASWRTQSGDRAE